MTFTWLSCHRAARMDRADLAVLESMPRIQRYLEQRFSSKEATEL